MIPLKQVRIETPCEADWEKMEGTEAVRFCAGCRKDVYNLSAMSRAEAERTLAGPGGLPCVRFHHDPAGAPLTREALPSRRRFLGVLVGALLALLGAAQRPVAAVTPGRPGIGAPSKPAPPATAGMPVRMGDIAPPRPPQPPALTGRIGPRAPRPHHAKSGRPKG